MQAGEQPVADLEQAAPEIAEQTPPETPAEPIPEKTFTQKELDRQIARRLNEQQRAFQREQAQRAAEVPPTNPDPYADPDVDALVNQRVEERLKQREQQAAQARIYDTYATREDEARDKYDDFDAVAYNPRLPVTDVMTQTIAESELGPEIAYFLGQNLAEARRIAQLTPFAQAAALGRIEAKLADAPPVARKTSSAPPPIAPVTPNGNRPAYDTTDPRSIDTMSMADWAKAEEARMRKKLQGSR